MDVYAVAGGDGAGKTATALDLTVALRGAGHYAAVLDADLGGNVASLLGLEFERTLEDVIDGDAGVRDAMEEYELSVDAIPESDLGAYRRALSADPTQFRATADAGGGTATAENDPDTDSVPVIAGWRDRDDHVSTNPDALAGVLDDLAMAYDVVVVDTGNGPAVESPTVDAADGTLVVTTPDPIKCGTAREAAGDCARAGADVLGVVVNRAGETTSVSDVTGRVGATAFGVVPEDARTAALEPVAFTVPEGPAATAYGRLAGKTASWDGTSGLLGPTPAEGGTEPAGTDVATDGDGVAEPDDDGGSSGGFLSGLFGRR